MGMKGYTFLTLDLDLARKQVQEKYPTEQDKVKRLIELMIEIVDSKDEDLDNYVIFKNSHDMIEANIIKDFLFSEEALNNGGY